MVGIRTDVGNGYGKRNVIQDFARESGRLLDRIEQAIEAAADEAGVDLEVSRQDNVIEVEFEDRSKLIVNSHQAAGEVWVAARAGGWHFRPSGPGGQWIDTRSGMALQQCLNEQLEAHAGHPLVVNLHA